MKITKKLITKRMIEKQGGVYNESYVLEPGSTVTLDALTYLEKCINENSAIFAIKTIERIHLTMGDKVDSCLMNPNGTIQIIFKK